MTDRTPITSPQKNANENRTNNVIGTGKSVGDRKYCPSPHELTAEWTVRAELKFARAGEKLSREFSSTKCNQCEPVCIVYKWSTLDEAASNRTSEVNNSEEKTSSTCKQRSVSRSRQSSPLKSAKTNAQKQEQDHEDSFRSTTSTLADIEGRDSAFSGSNASKNQSLFKENASFEGSNGLYGTRCESSCNIVFSAVADFLPLSEKSENQELTSYLGYRDGIKGKTGMTVSNSPNQYPRKEINLNDLNSTDDYVELPEKCFDRKLHFEKSAVRDAYSQTSDTEAKYFEEKYENLSSHNISLVERQLSDCQNKSSQVMFQTTDSQNSFPRNKASSILPATQKSKSLSKNPLDLEHTSVDSTQSNLLETRPDKNKERPMHGTKDQQKKPRTVHIDVYCTGSEEEDNQADTEYSSSSIEDEIGPAGGTNTNDIVYDSEKVCLKHQRVRGTVLPRRVEQKMQSPEQKLSNHYRNLCQQSADIDIMDDASKCSTAAEVTESKQLLFRKHIDDQRAAKLINLRHKYIRQASDDALSSNYPNSSHSTVRDVTCSSISSVVPSLYGDCTEKIWREFEDHKNFQPPFIVRRINNFPTNDSIEQNKTIGMTGCVQLSDKCDNSTNMSDSSLQDPYDRQIFSPLSLNCLQPIYEGNSHRGSPFSTPFQIGTTTPSESENSIQADLSCSLENDEEMLFKHSLTSDILYKKPRPGFLQFFGPSAFRTSSKERSLIKHKSTSPLPPRTDPTSSVQPSDQSYLQRWKSEACHNLSANVPVMLERGQNNLEPANNDFTSRCGSEVASSQIADSSCQPAVVGRRLEIKRYSPSASETSTIISGYTTEYLEKANKFGKVVGTARKPGHHVGPTKNPNCLCESCQRWLSERFKVRGRAFSLGDRPILKKPS